MQEVIAVDQAGSAQHSTTHFRTALDFSFPRDYLQPVRQSLQRFYVRWLDAVVGLCERFYTFGIFWIFLDRAGHDTGIVFYRFWIGSLCLYSGVYYILTLSWNDTVS